MKKTVLATMLVALALRCAAASPSDDAKKKSKAAAKTAPAPTVTIPEGAVKDGNHYRYVDKNGKAWIYRETPFGVTKRAETPSDTNTSASTPFGNPSGNSPASGQPAPDRTASVTAVREGDTIHFTRPSPFGMAKWDKKIQDLTPDEQKVWEREEAKRKQ